MSSSRAPLGRRPLLTPGERRADSVLGEISQHLGYRTFAHVKLSDVINQRPAGITGAQWSYATRAHFDFVVCDGETMIPEFAVELDDASHRSAEAHRRDRMKDAVCAAAGLELLRIEPPALAPTARGRRVVEYLIDARAMSQAFERAQAEGSVPVDEPFDYRSFLDLRPDGRVDFINDLAMPARAKAMAAHRARRVGGQRIEGAHFYWRSGIAEGWAWLRIKEDLFLFERTVVRSYQFDCGLGAGELAEDLSTAAIGDQIDAMARGDAVLLRVDYLQRRLDEIRRRSSQLEDTFCLDELTFER
jgi:Protein of unknown function (DUF2726)